MSSIGSSQFPCRPRCHLEMPGNLCSSPCLGEQSPSQNASFGGELLGRRSRGEAGSSLSTGKAEDKNRPSFSTSHLVMRRGCL